MVPEKINNTSKEGTFKFSDGLIIASIPFTAYTLLFIFESGAFNYWKIPLQFISLDLGELFAVTGFSFITTILVFYNFSDFLSKFIFTKVQGEIAKGAIIAITIVNIWIIVVGILYYFCYGTILFVVFFVGLFLYFNNIALLPILKIKGKFFEKFTKYFQQKTPSKPKSSLTGYIITNVGKKITLLFIGWIMIGFILYYYSYAVAKYQRIYPVAQLNPDCAVVYIKPDKSICLNFDRSSKTFTQGFRVINYNDYPGLSFDSEIIGPLLAKNIPSSQLIPEIISSPTSINTPVITKTLTKKATQANTITPNP